MRSRNPRKTPAGAAFATANKRDEAAYRAAMLYLDAERAVRLSDLARKDIDSRKRVLDTVQAQVQEGRVLPLAQKQAELAIAQARQTALDLEDQRDSAETSLAIALGFRAEDRIAPAAEDRAAPSCLPRPRKRCRLPSRRIMSCANCNRR